MACEKSCELPKTRTAAICRSAHKGLICRNFLLVPQEGFEPPTPSLRMMCHTGERLTLRIYSPYVSKVALAMRSALAARPKRPI